MLLVQDHTLRTTGLPQHRIHNAAVGKNWNQNEKRNLGSGPDLLPRIHRVAGKVTPVMSAFAHL